MPGGRADRCADGCSDVRPVHNTDGRATAAPTAALTSVPSTIPTSEPTTRPDDGAVAAALAGPDGLLLDPARFQEDVPRRLAVRITWTYTGPATDCLDVDVIATRDNVTIVGPLTTPNDGAFSFDLPYGIQGGIYGRAWPAPTGRASAAAARRPYSFAPTIAPSPVPSSMPTSAPTATPTSVPTTTPTRAPTAAPTFVPTPPSSRPKARQQTHIRPDHDAVVAAERHTNTDNAERHTNNRLSRRRRRRHRPRRPRRAASDPASRP